MAELRQDPSSGLWVIVAPGRSRRPGAVPRSAQPPPLPEYDPNCPFCPGHEEETPPAVHVDPPGPGWQVRVIPNKYPAVQPPAVQYPAGQPPAGSPPALTPRVPELFVAQPATGYHEVIVESPRHNQTPATMSSGELARVLAAYRARYRELSRRPGVAAVQIFRNQGPRAGASLAHPHSQVLALPWVPPGLEARLDRAEAYFRETGRCLYCDLVAAEEAAGERWVAGGRGFVAFCPFAPRYPYETWILPRQHQTGFGELTDNQVAELAALLGDLLRRLERLLGRPDYNLVLHSHPGAGQGPAAGGQGFHWHLQVAPRLYPDGGFEVGSGAGIVIQAPEAAARELRDAGRAQPRVDMGGM